MGGGSLLKQLFASDKAPFILALALSVMGWLVTTAVGNLSDVVVLGVDSSRNANRMVFSVTNHSVKKPFVDGVIGFRCAQSDCLAEKNGTYVKDEPILPYSIQGNKICSASARAFMMLLSLPPKATIQYEVYLNSRAAPRFEFKGMRNGAEEERCPTTDSKLKVDNIWIIEGNSPVPFMLDYYNHFLFGSILLTLIFLLLILFRESPKKKWEEWS
jgi:hypothetical protein